MYILLRKSRSWTSQNLLKKGIKFCLFFITIFYNTTFDVFAVENSKSIKLGTQCKRLHLLVFVTCSNVSKIICICHYHNLSFEKIEDIWRVWNWWRHHLNVLLDIIYSVEISRYYYGSEDPGLLRTIRTNRWKIHVCNNWKRIR